MLPSESTFELKEFVEAANDATNRSRYVSIVLLIATILIFVGLNNEYRNSWFVDDIRNAYDLNDDYLRGLLDPDPGKSYLFKVSDFKAPASLTTKLREGKDPLSQYLFGRFRANVQSKILKLSPNQSASGLAMQLTTELNEVLKGQPLFNDEVFREIQLSAQTRELLGQNPNADKLILLNRMLLEDAYPDDIVKFDRFFRPSRIPMANGSNNDLIRPADVAKRDIQRALLRTHVESRLLIRIPILGVAIHVNDLGLIGGLTLIVLLLLTRTSLSREIKNLNYSFKKAYEATQLEEFYDALAMRQLFTTPHMKGENRNRLLSKAPYAVCLLPVLIYFLLGTYDAYTIFVIPRYNRELLDKTYFEMIKNLLSSRSILWVIVIEFACMAMIFSIAFRCLERQHYIYYIWDSYWKLLKSTPSLCLLEPGVVVALEKYNGIVIQLEKAVLSDSIIADLKEEEVATKPFKMNLLSRFVRAIREEASPIVHFLLRKKSTAQKPRLVEIDSKLAELFSNDKEINDTLRRILTRKEQDTELQQEQEVVADVTPHGTETADIDSDDEMRSDLNKKGEKD